MKLADKSGARSEVPLALSAAESAARSTALAWPIFFSLHKKSAWSTAAWVGMAGAGAVYYLAWGRFFVGGGSVALLSAPWMGIPSPLALSPVAVLVLASYLMNSWWMFTAALSFGVFHVWALSLARL